MLAFEIATSVRNVRELGRLSVLFLIASTFPPLIVKMGSGLTLLWTCELVGSARRVFLSSDPVSEWTSADIQELRHIRIEVNVDVGAPDRLARVVVDDPVQGHFLS